MEKRLAITIGDCAGVGPEIILKAMPSYLDEVIVYGKVVNYKGNTPQFAQGSYITSLNGKTK